MNDEAALIDRAVRGDVEAFGALVVAHRPTVVRIARHLLGDAATAEDVAQDVLVRLQAALPGFRGDAALGTWLYRVTLNLCRDYQRRDKRRHDDVDVDAAAGSPALTVDAHPGRAVDHQHLVELVRAAIDTLPAQQKEAVMLRYLEDMSYAEIARVTDTPQGTVASRVFRALQRLGEHLEPRHLELVK